MYKNGFGINNLQGLMCHKITPKQTKLNLISMDNGYRTEFKPRVMADKRKKSDGERQKAREREGGSSDPCCRHALMIMMMITL